MLAGRAVVLVTAVNTSVANAALVVPTALSARLVFVNVTPPIDKGPVLMKSVFDMKIVGAAPLTEIDKNESACADVVRLNTRIAAERYKKSNFHRRFLPPRAYL
jgi:hypothetical protein